MAIPLSFSSLILTILLIILNQELLAQEGEFKQYFYENGKVSSEGYIRDSKPDGYWKTYYPSGILKSEGNRFNFALDSIWKFYNEDGDLVNAINYVNGKRNGVTTVYNSGVIYEQWMYRDDIRVDSYLQFYPTGELKQKIPVSEGKENGDGFEYDVDGRIITFLKYKDGYLKSAEKVNRYDTKGNKRGPWYIYHSNGMLAEEGTYMNDQRNGIFKFYDSKGDLLRVEKYRDGQLVSDTEESIVLDLRSTYNEDGTIRSSGGYVDGKKEGTHRIFDSQGSVIIGEVYKGGVKTGEGLVDMQGGFQGPWKLYYDDGTVMAEGAYEDSYRNGDWVFYHKNGKVEHKGKYLKGLPHGPWKWYYENGVLRREESFRRGKEEGEVVEYDIEGGIITKGNYTGGLREGEWYYHVGDHTEKGNYRDGERHGEWIYEYPDGKISFKGNYQVGLPVGKHRWYHPNGQLKMDGKYSSGVRSGTWRSYDEEGVEYLNIKYRRGQELKINGKRVIEALQEDDI